MGSDKDSFETYVNQHKDLGWLSPVHNPSSREYLLELVDRYDPDQIGDVGCGAGTFVQELAERNPDKTVVGIDPAASAAKPLEETYDNVTIEAERLETVIGDLSCYDLLYANNVVQATEDPPQTLRYLQQTLCDDGQLVLVVPGDEAGGEQFTTSPDDPRYDITWKTENSLKKMTATFPWDGEQIQRTQYVFPREHAESIFESAGLSFAEEDLPYEIEADTSSLPWFLETFGVTVEEPINPENITLQMDLYILEKTNP